MFCRLSLIGLEINVLVSQHLLWPTLTRFINQLFIHLGSPPLINDNAVFTHTQSLIHSLTHTQTQTLLSRETARETQVLNSAVWGRGFGVHSNSPYRRTQGQPPLFCFPVWWAGGGGHSISWNLLWMEKSRKERGGKIRINHPEVLSVTVDVTYWLMQL